MTQDTIDWAWETRCVVCDERVTQTQIAIGQFYATHDFRLAHLKCFVAYLLPFEKAIAEAA